MKILAQLINLVPYHLARWSAVAALPGLDVHVLQLRAWDEFKILETATSTVPFEVHTLGCLGEKVSPKELQNALADTISRIAPDVVVINGYSFPISLAMLAAAGSLRIPVVICSESNRNDFPRHLLTEAIKRRVVRHCGAGLAGGTYQKDYLCNLGLPETRIFTGYNAVDNDHFREGADIARTRDGELRRSMSLPERYFLAVARFGEKKNLDGLIRSYASFLSSADRKVPDLIVLGDGPLREALERQISALQLVGRIHLLGSISYRSLPTYYGLAFAFVHASITEQWGLVVNEAMAAGLPVLVSARCGCAHDLVVEGLNGRVFDPLSSVDFASALNWANELNFDDWERASCCSRERISHWSPSLFAVNLLKAAEAAISFGPVTIFAFDRILLRALIRREINE